MKYGNLTLGQTEAIMNKLGGEEGAMSLLRDELVVTKKQVVLDTVEMQIVVDYSLTLAEMISTGQYGWHNDDITDRRFPHQQKVTLTSVLVHLNRSASTDEVLAELARRGLRPATCAELLAFGATYPEVQRKFPVAALGQSALVAGSPDVPLLYEDDRERRLDLYWAGIDWGGDYRFLAFAL